MWRRLNREDLVASNPFLELAPGHGHTFVWHVYETYEAQSLDNDSCYLRAAEGSSVKRRYEPLLDTPHLFLEFARLDEARNFGQALSEWIAKYGLLGLHSRETRRFRGPHLELFPREYSDRGGLEEKPDSFGVEIFHANWALSLYEAAVSREKEKLEEVVFADEGMRQHPNRELYDLIAGTPGGTHIDVLVDIAMSTVSGLIQEVLKEFAYPCPTFGLSRRGPEPSELRSPKSLTASLWPRNLLGAMYLQFYWLTTSGGDISRCKYCGRIISYVPPVPDSTSRKPRKDKEFCDSRCRQNYHYHNRIKASRQDKETS